MLEKSVKSLSDSYMEPTMWPCGLVFCLLPLHHHHHQNQQQHKHNTELSSPPQRPTAPPIRPPRSRLYAKTHHITAALTSIHGHLGRHGVALAKHNVGTAPKAVEGHEGRRGGPLNAFSTLRTWGNQRMLGFTTKAEGGVASDNKRIWRAAGKARDNAGLEEIREKLLVHLREAADRMNITVPPPTPATVEDLDAKEAALPWRLMMVEGKKRS